MRNTRQQSRLPTPWAAHSFSSFALALLVAVLVVPAQALENRWITTGSLNVARHGHTATLLPDGRVLVVGGRNSDFAPLGSAELYDPITGTWKMTGALRATRARHTATLLQDGKVLVTGGIGVGTPSTPDAEVFDPVTETWSTTGNLRLSRQDHTATLLHSGKVLVVGSGGFGPRHSAELYDPASGTWSFAALPNSGRSAHTATLLPNGEVLVAGGIPWVLDSNEIPPTVAELYDPVTDSWRDVGAPMIVYWHSAALLPNGLVLIAGGPNVRSCDRGLGCLMQTGHSAILFDPAAGTWRYASNSRKAHSSWTTATLMPTGQVLLVGRAYRAPDSPASDPFADTAAETYDPGSDVWTVGPELAAPRSDHSATLLLDGRVLVAGGTGSGRGTPTATGYHPYVHASAELYESAGPAAIIGPGFTGSWFNPAQNGHGLTLEVLPGVPPRLLASWFTFAPQGGPAWIIGLGPINGSRAQLQGYQSVGSGGRFPPNFDAANVRQEFWGDLTFTFRDCDHGRVEWMSVVPGYGSGGMDLTRLTLPAGLTCSNDKSGASDWDY